MFVFSQKETAWWFFGGKAGLHFHSGGVTVLPGVSPLIGQNGYSSLSDSSGNLLFYSNYSYFVFNKIHDTMANGISTGGNLNVQASLIFPKSGSLYYLFKHNNLNYYNPGIPPMLSYSIVDMSLASGNGSVTLMNIPITPTGVAITKMAGARHCNGQDYWLLTHRADMPNGSNQFYAYQVGAAGVSANPVISTIGSMQPHHYNNYLFFNGRMKFSPNGKKICSVYPYRTVELYDFDNNTGQLSNVIKLDSVAVTSSSVWPYAYDVEFSSDGSKLYVSYCSFQTLSQTHPFLCQFDLTAGSAQAIAASKIILDPGFDYFFEDLQLGMDGKIYIGQRFGTNLHVIQNPNATGLACAYDSVGINMGIIPGSTVQSTPNSGLPSFISNYFEQKPSFPAFTYTASCGLVSFYSPTVTAFPATGYSVNSYQWNFGDPVTGASNSSTLSNPSHTFSSNGSYPIQLLIHYSCGTDTLKQTVTVSSLPVLTINGKSNMCQGETQSLNFSGVNSYSVNGTAISNASTAIQPTANSVYTVSGFDNSTGCTTINTFTVLVKPCTSILELNDFKNQFQVFPNPHQDELTIEAKTKCHAVLIDFTGRVVKEQELSPGNNVISVEGNSKGIYFLKVQSEENSITLKVVKD